MTNSFSFRHRHSIPAAMALALCAASAPASAEEPWVRIATGLNYSTGKYGDVADTEVWSVPVSVKYNNGPFSVRAAIPFVRIKGPGSLVNSEAGGGSGVSSGIGGGSGSANGVSGGTVIPGGQRRAVSGIGDATVTAMYGLEFPGDWYVDLSGKVKIPTASTAKRLGTGKVDVTAGAEVTKMIGKGYVFAGGRRRFSGSSASLPVRDIWGFGFGGGVRVSSAVTLGVDYDWQQSSVRGNTPSSEITATASIRLNKALRLSLYGATGLNDNSADAAVGAQIGWKFGI